MHHFTLHTSSSLLLQDHDVKQAWESVVPELALEHPFLMQGLLALSALHLAYLRPNEEASWTRLASEHQNRGIAAIQPMISKLTSYSGENVHALFAATIMLTISSMVDTKFASLEQAKAPVGISKIISPILHIRGITQVCDLSSIMIQAGPLASMFFTSVEHKTLHVSNPSGFTTASFLEHWAKTFSKRPCNSFTQTQFHRLKTVLRKEEMQQDVYGPLNEALSSLEMLYAEVNYTASLEKPNWYPGLVWKWPAMLSQQFAVLLQANHPAALIIFAHFAILSVIFAEWYLSGWPKRALASISAVLSEPWSGLLDWAMKESESRLEGICGTE
jgi:hypothetical protein